MGVLHRHDDGLDPGASERVGQHQRARDRAHGAVQAELAEHAGPVEATLRQVRLGEHQRERDGELEPGTGLAHVAGREVDGDPLEREVHAGGEERGAHPLA